MYAWSLYKESIRGKRSEERYKKSFFTDNSSHYSCVNMKYEIPQSIFSNEKLRSVYFDYCMPEKNLRRVLSKLRKHKNITELGIDECFIKKFDILFNCLNSTGVSYLSLGREKYFPEYVKTKGLNKLPKNITKLELSNMNCLEYINLSSTNLKYLLLEKKEINDQSLIKLLKEVNNSKITKLKIKFKKINYHILFNNLGKLEHLEIDNDKKLNDKNIIDLLKKTNLKSFDVKKTYINSDYLFSILRKTKLEDLPGFYVEKEYELILKKNRERNIVVTFFIGLNDKGSSLYRFARMEIFDKNVIKLILDFYWKSNRRMLKYQKLTTKIRK